MDGWGRGIVHRGIRWSNGSNWVRDRWETNLVHRSRICDAASARKLNSLVPCRGPHADIPARFGSAQVNLELSFFSQLYGLARIECNSEIIRGLNFDRGTKRET